MSLRWASAFIKDASGATVNDTSFWKHEYEKHGSCSPFNSKDYFEKTLALDAVYPVNKWLAESKVVPDNSQTYSADDFKSALTKHIYASQYFLRCVKVKNAANGDVWWLKDLVLCVSYLDAHSLIQCPHIPELTCPDKFYFVKDFTS